MILSQLFAKLSRGVLSNLSMSETPGVIVTSSQAKVCSEINDGLMELATRFIIKEKRLRIELHEDIGFYYLMAPFAVSYTPAVGETSMPVRYILDTTALPFRGDVVKVLQVFSASGMQMPLNNEEHPQSLFTPEPLLLQVPYQEYLDGYVEVVYQAMLRRIPNTLDAVVDCPEFLIPALCNYVAYKIYGDLGTQESLLRSQRYQQMFEAECQKFTTTDLLNTSRVATNVRFERGGWV